MRYEEDAFNTLRCTYLHHLYLCNVPYCDGTSDVIFVFVVNLVNCDIMCDMAVGFVLLCWCVNDNAVAW